MSTQERQRTAAPEVEVRGTGEFLPATYVAEPEIVEEIARYRERPITIAELSLLREEVTIQELNRRRESSIKLTYPEDWVLYRARDGSMLGYLQDVGCQRIRPLWGISFDRIDLLKDLVREPVGDDLGNVQFLAAVRGKCEVTQEHADEIGARATAHGIFKDQWADAQDDPAELKRLEIDVRKSALANARGRLIRHMTGMGSVPVDELRAHGLDVRRCRGVQFREGARGGGQSNQDEAGEGQLNLLAGTATHEGKVKGYSSRDYRAVREAIGGAQLTKKRASDLITRLKNAKEPVPLEAFWQGVGIDPPSNGASGRSAGKRAPNEDAPADPGAQKCPGCNLTWKFISSDGHTPECKQPSWKPEGVEG